MSQLQQRLLVGTIAALLVAGGIWIGTYPCFRPLFATGVAFVIGLALWEYYSLAKQVELSPPHTLGLIISTFYVLAVFLVTQYPICSSLPTIVLALGSASIFAYFFFFYDRPLENIAVTVFGIGYITLTLSGIVGILFLTSESGDDGRLWLMYLIVVTKITDTAAYFFGKTLGKKKMAPSLSPKKTWAGALGGLGFALIASLSLYVLSLHITGFHLTLLAAILLGLVIGVLAQVGDLAESVLKRSAKVKDSSHLPGLGGVLDVVDSLIFTTPLLYLYLQCRQGM